MSASTRALHYVLKVADLKKNIEFFRDKLAMTVLRHEVFDEGCEAACNGPYDNKWSKTMIGYGPEDNFFVLELTYNYTVGHYKLGNDLQHLKVSLDVALFDKVSASLGQGSVDNFELASPDGYKFIIERSVCAPSNKSNITEVCLSCSDLENSKRYWSNLLKMSKMSKIEEISCEQNETLFRYSPDQASLRLRQVAGPLDRGTAFGRIAFSCPADLLKPIQESIQRASEKVLTPYVSLDTPGKASVEVVILADPDGHEICLVGDEGFRELSKVDPRANELIEKSMAEDQSSEWFAKKGKTKTEAS